MPVLIVSGSYKMPLFFFFFYNYIKSQFNCIFEAGFFFLIGSDMDP